jgi:tetratricopeptide (TPR) repeat protein
MTLRLTVRLGALFLLGIALGVSKPSPAISSPARAGRQAPDDKLEARGLLSKGVAAYKDGQFDEAIEYFRQAKELDPNSLNARLYLATAYASQYIPGAPSEENIRLAEKSVEEFKGVLQLDPNNLSAIDGMGAILYNLGGNPLDPKKFQESKSYHNQHIKLQPEDPEPYFWIGVIDWSMAYKKNKELRATYNETAREKLPDDQAMPPSVMAAFIQDNGTVVDEGISCLKKAIDLNPDYDDAMAYLNLLYRQKADMEWNRQHRDSDLELADDLLDQVKKMREKRMRPQLPQSE